MRSNFKQVQPTLGILIVANFFVAAQGGWGPHLDIANAFINKGWRVVRTSWYRKRSLRLLDMLWTTWQKRKCYKVAQVDVYSGPAFIWAEVVCLLLALLNKPFILTLHGGNLPSFALRQSFRVRRILNSAAIVTVPSAYLADQMRIYRDNLIMLPNPVALDRYPYERRDQPQPHLIWLRSFRYLYNPQMAVRAVAYLVNDFPDIQLTMIGHDSGDGTLQAVQSLACELGITANLEIVPGVAKNEVPTWLTRNDIFLNTTTVDNTPVSVIEAQASGLCVICTRVGGLPYMLQGDVDALIVPSDDAESLAAAIRRILTEPQLAAELSHNGHQNAQQYDLRAVTAHWEELFSSLIESG